MCEDSVEKLSMDNIRNPLQSLIPLLIELFHCPEEIIRVRAIETINSTLFLLSTSSLNITPRRDSLGKGEIYL